MPSIPPTALTGIIARLEWRERISRQAAKDAASFGSESAEWLEREARDWRDAIEALGEIQNAD